MVAKPQGNSGMKTMLTVKRDTYRKMTEVRKTAGTPTAALKAVFAQGMSMIKAD